MRIDYLKEFIELSYCLNFTKAAANLNITQSALSKHILNLEDELGVMLFDRTPTHVALTENGKLLFQEALHLIEAHDAIVEKMRKAAARKQVIIGGMTYSPLIHSIADAAAETAEQHGMPVELRYRSVLTNTPKDALRDGEVDVVFTMYGVTPEKNPEVERVFLYSEPLVAVMEKDNPLADRDELTFDDLRGATLIKPSGTYQILGNSAVEDILQASQFDGHTRVAFLDSIADFHTVPLGKDVFLIEQSLARTRNLDESRAIIPFKADEADLSICAVFRSNENDPAILAFKDALSAVS